MMFGKRSKSTGFQAWVRPRCAVAAVALSAAAVAAPPAARAGETLFTGGVVWTANPAQPRAEAVLVRDGVIRYVGGAAEAAGQASKDARIVRLRGGMLLPGFVESHSHPAVAGLLNSKLQIIGTRTVAEVQAALAKHAKAHPDATVLFGFGFPSALNTAVNAAGVTGPHRKDLDAVVADRPVMLIALDAHSAWLNSKALAVAGIDKNTPDPLPGVHYYQREANGEPTGWMVEGGAFWPLLPHFGVGTKADFRAAFEAMLPKLSAMGVTTVFDAGIPGGDDLVRAALTALAEMDRAGRLPMRVRASAYLNRVGVTGEEMAARIRALRAAATAPLVDLRTAKIGNDGTIEGKTAATLEPYAGGGSGAVMLAEKPLADFLGGLRQANLDAHIHAIGDGALRVAVNALATARAAHPEADSQTVVAHVMMAAPEDLKRLRDVNLSVQTSPHWAHDIGGSLALYSRLLDARRGARVMRLRDLWEAAPLVAFGADYPATGLPFEQTSPLHGIEIGITRRAPGAVDGEPLPPARQSLTLTQMLTGYTINGARQLRLAAKTGSIVVGKQADLVVLERDLFAEPPHRIHAVRVDMTMLAGRVVHRRADASGGEP